MSEHIAANHVGFLCRDRKVAIIRAPRGDAFTIEDLATFQMVHEGIIQRRGWPDGEYGVCDFSRLDQPGVYRLRVVHDSELMSFQFVIADGVFHRLPLLFVDFLHQLRSGPFSNDLKGFSHMDDGRRSDTDAAHDAVGGWYDAGDTRKWMAHSTLPAWGLLEVYEQLGLQRNQFGNEATAENDLLTEAAWGLAIIPKMQDPQSGMIWEDVGGGNDAHRKPELGWWYENHAGCGANNSDNRFTDNRPESGDERRIRVRYNPIVQYVNQAMLACGARWLSREAQGYRACAQRLWDYCKTVRGDAFHEWVSVRSWRALAAMQRHRAGWAGPGEADDEIRWLLKQFDSQIGFWRFSSTSREPYRGILHSAQPVIALAEYVRTATESDLADKAIGCLHQMLQTYAIPMADTNPYGFMPFGQFREEMTDADTYRTGPGGLKYRYFMPDRHPQRINHGLAGHWTSWAHGLALVAKVLNDQSARDLAWRQIYWLIGMNDHSVSFISGVGYNNPMPHSRFLGTLIGGFMNGFHGSADDKPLVDLHRKGEWQSTEYWNVPLSNCLLALAHLLPREIPEGNKLGKHP